MKQVSFEISDVELLQRLRDPYQQHHVFSIFYHRYKKYVFSICSRACSQFIEGGKLAEDIFQNTMLKVYNNGANFNATPGVSEKDISNQIKAWLGRIANNELLDYLKNNPDSINLDSRHRLEAENIGEEFSNNLKDIENVHLSISRKKLENALSQLSEKERHVLMTYMQYYDVDNPNRHLPDDVVNNLCLSLKSNSENIRQIKSRALKKLKKIINAENA